MAGQLTIDTLKASTGVLATQNGMTGIAKAWVRFSAASASVVKSFNVGSITAYGGNIFGVNFTTAMPDANYTWTATAGASIASGTNYQFPLITCADYTGVANWAVPTTTQIRFITEGWTGGGGAGASTYTFDRVCIAIFD